MVKQNKKMKKSQAKKGDTCCNAFNCNCLKNNFLTKLYKKSPRKVGCAYSAVAIILVLILISYLFEGLSNRKIKNWVNKNPEVILDSVNKFVSEKQQEMMEQRQKMASEGIKKRKKEIQDTSYAGVVNPRGSITVVEFSDYNCGYCKHVAGTVEKIANFKTSCKSWYSCCNDGSKQILCFP